LGEKVEDIPNTIKKLAGTIYNKITNSATTNADAPDRKEQTQTRKSERGTNQSDGNIDVSG
jgi:hypothetical protein